MPQYYRDKKDFNIIPRETVQEMIDSTDDLRMRCIISLAWITGARITEIMKLRRQDFKGSLKDDVVFIRLNTIKGGVPRRLELSMTKTPFLLEYVVKYVKHRHGRIFDIGVRRAQQKLLKINEKTGYYITFHEFRHSRISYLAREKEASLSELMDWTGWASTRQAGNYLIRKTSKRFRDQIE